MSFSRSAFFVQGCATALECRAVLSAQNMLSSRHAVCAAGLRPIVNVKGPYMPLRALCFLQSCATALEYRVVLPAQNICPHGMPCLWRSFI
jgi:hypothetical protein